MTEKDTYAYCEHLIQKEDDDIETLDKNHHLKK